MPSVFIQTHGCAKNEADSRHMSELLSQAGFSLAEDPSSADVLIVNTCGFLEAASRESLEATLELAQGKGEKTLIMTGCVPSRYKGDLVSELPEVDAFVEALDEESIVEVVGAALKSKEIHTLAPSPEGETFPNKGWEYVKISDGCNRFCSFCTIPFIRGRYASRPSKEIYTEIEGLLEKGLKEIVLVGQDTGVYGSDFAEKPDELQSLADLVRYLAPLFNKFGAKFRILYIQPDGITDDLLGAFAEVDELVNYFDIPIQHTSSRLLKAMRRKGSAEEFRDLFSHIKKKIPGAILRTTAMVGFPGETEKEFEKLLDFIDEIGFDYVSSFAYSREEPGRAAYLEDQIPEDIKQERLQLLMDRATLVGERKMAAHVGETEEVLITGKEDGLSIGRTWFQAPDSDGLVSFEEELEAGKVFSAKLVEANGFDFVGALEGGV